MIAFGLTNRGLVRKANEDSFLCCLRRQLFAVADGMGGHLAGEVASKLAIQTLNDKISDVSDKNPKETLLQAVIEANTVIYKAAENNAAYEGMGTTLTAAIINGDKLYISHVGDSRLYLIREKSLQLLTSDHSLVTELVNTGQISSDEAKNHPQKHMLTRALGTCPIVEIDCQEIEIKPDDLLIFCTDGLSNLVSDKSMTQITKNKSIEESSYQLLNMALESGGHDNITVVLVKV